MEAERGLVVVEDKITALKRAVEGDDNLFEQCTRLNAAYREIFRVAAEVTDTFQEEGVPKEILTELAALVSCARQEKERFLDLASAAFPTGGGK